MAKQFLQLKLENWRNFKLVDVALQKRVLLAGPNASGKSNFLDALRFLQDLVALGGGLREAVGNRDGISKIRCLSARRKSAIALEVKIGDKAGTDEWRYRVQFNQDAGKRPLVKNETVWFRDKVLLERPDKEDKSDPERLTQTHLEQVSANKNFRPIAVFLGSVRYLHIIPQMVRDPNRYLHRDNDPYGGAFLEQLASVPEATRNKRLGRILQALQVAVPQLRALEIERDERGTPHIRGRWEHWRPKAGWQREQQFSDGTLRLLGLLWAMVVGSGPLLLEEPELSLHSEVVRYIPQMLATLTRSGKKQRQVILSSHSSDLFADEGIAADEVLLLYPSGEGTRIELAEDNEQISDLLDGGTPMNDIVASYTAPAHASQLSTFER